MNNLPLIEVVELELTEILVTTDGAYSVEEV